MMPDDLNDALDVMEVAAAGNSDLMPGMITVESGHWMNVLSEVRATRATLHDGMRHRNIKIAVSSQLKTKLLTRAETGDRREPYRDLAPRA